MQDNRYPTLADVKTMQVAHGKLVAAKMNSSSNGMEPIPVNPVECR